MHSNFYLILSGHADFLSKHSSWNETYGEIMMKCISRIILFSVLIIISFLCYSIGLFSNELNEIIEESCLEPKENLTLRRERLDKYCDIYSNPFRPESSQVYAQNLAAVNSYQYFSWKNNFHMICSIQKAGSNSMHNFLRKVLQAYINEPYHKKMSNRNESDK